MPNRRQAIYWTTDDPTLSVVQKALKDNHDKSAEFRYVVSLYGYRDPLHGA